MPLTIECVCEDAPDVSVCQLVALDFQVEATYSNNEYGVNALVELKTTHGGGWVTGTPTPVFSFDTGSSSASSSLDLTDAVNNWNTLEVHFNIASSNFQPLSAGKFAAWSMTWHIRMTYQCIDSAGNVSIRYVYARPGDTDQCIEDWPGFIRSMVFGGGGGGFGILYNSSALSGGGCDIYLSNFTPRPLDNSINVEGSDPTAICFCASGGFEPYSYALVSGTLPGGLFLDPETGCLTGALTEAGRLAQTEVTIMVTDANQDQAQVTCNLWQNCGPGIANAFY